MNDLKTMDLLPSDEDTAEWFEDNIGIVNNCSASSAIYKFRLWLKDRQQYADQQEKKEAIEFAEWIDKSSFSAMDIDDDKIVWYSKNESQKTTEQLYELFKQK